jgi:hypothetical protein
MTLFFIITISILILKNLNDSNKFIDEVALDSKLTQIKIANKNIQDEVIKLIDKNKDDIDQLLEITTAGFPFKYGDVDLIIKIDEYFNPDCNLNKIEKTEDLNKYCTDNIISSISYPYDFVKLIKQYQPFTNKKQVDFFIDKYIEYTKDDTLYNIQDSLGFNSIDANNTSNIFISCKYDIKIKDTTASSSFLLKVGSKKIENNSFYLVLTN